MSALTQITTRAKTIRRGNKNMTWKTAVKKASVEYRAKHKAKPVKKAVTKKAATKKTVSAPQRNVLNSARKVTRHVISGVNVVSTISIHKRYSPYVSSAALDGKRISIKKAMVIIQNKKYVLDSQIELGYGLDMYYKLLR